MRDILNILTLLLTTTSLTYAYEEYRSFLETYVPVQREFKTISFNAVEATANTSRSRRLLRLTRRLQNIPSDMKFPCNLNATLRSEEVPNSVHKLRPGDIDIVGALGDSLTAGFGILATTVLEIVHEGRGSSFSIGGQETWRTQLTLPNILKNFNPNIYGYSLHSITTDRESKFNVAEGGAMSQDMPYMAKVLVKRMKSDRRVNLQKDWKMISIFIGHNDFCSNNCYKQDFNKILSDHKRDILQMLRIFKKNLPRTVVNLIPPLNVMNLITSLKDKPQGCQIVHVIGCSCVMGLPHLHLRSKMIEIMTKWQELDIEIANYPEFDKEDFSVIMHKFSANYTVPQLKEGGTDYGYIAADCFHASQRGHARLANDLWNSLLESYNDKSMNSRPEFEKFLCPSEARPYIFTKRNSNNRAAILKP